MNRILSDEEIRHMLISAMTAPTERDKQTRIGASDLADDCDRCVARAFLGIKFETTRSRRLWMGAYIGTGIHRMLEAAMADHPGARAERHVFFGEIAGYGEVGGTIDLDLGSQILDYKSADRAKLALLRDFISIQGTGEPIFGRKHKWIAGAGRGMMPESEYNEKMASMGRKITRGYNQCQLYLRGHGEAQVGSLVYVARDANGWFEVPDLDGYDNPRGQHDIHVVTFAYNPDYAQSLMDRGQAIWDRLAAGEGLPEFAQEATCFICGDEAKAEAALDGEPVLVPINNDIKEAA